MVDTCSVPGDDRMFLSPLRSPVKEKHVKVGGSRGAQRQGLREGSLPRPQRSSLHSGDCFPKTSDIADQSEGDEANELFLLQTAHRIGQAQVCGQSSTCKQKPEHINPIGN